MNGTLTGRFRLRLEELGGPHPSRLNGTSPTSNSPRLGCFCGSGLAWVRILGMQICVAIVFCICKCLCNRVGLDKFFDLDLIGVGFRWNGL